MASSTALSPVTPSQLCSGKNGLSSHSNMALVKCVKSGSGVRKDKRMKVSCMATNPSPHTESILEENGSIDYRKGVKNLVDSAPHMKKLPSQFVLHPRLGPNLLSEVTYSEIPMIDLSGLNGSIESRISTVEAISSACVHWGFFRIMNHGINETVIEEMLKVIEDFFGLCLEEKMKYYSEDVMSSIRYGTSLNTSIKHALHWRDYFRHYGHPFHKTHFNLWPNNPPNYRKVAKDYLDEIWNVSMKIAGAISEGLGLDNGYIEKSLGDGLQILAANYYPPCPEPNKTLGLAAHSDHGALTILMQNPVDGLQIKHDEKWIAVPHLPNTLLVNIGDYLEILSNGKYKSVEHRAAVNDKKTRISVAVGHGPELSSTIGPASPLVNKEEGFQYRPILYEDYIKLQQSSIVRGKTSLQALMTKSCGINLTSE